MIRPASQSFTGANSGGHYPPVERRLAGCRDGLGLDPELLSEQGDLAAQAVVSAIHPPHTTRVILEHLGLPARAPPIATATDHEDLSSDDLPAEYADLAGW